MERAINPTRAPGFAVYTALAAALLGGFVSHSAMAQTDAGAIVVTGKAFTDQASRAILKAEARVEKDPRSISRRNDLAHVYLSAGRFDSAATTFSDAMALGDKDPRTALGLALSYIGSGRNAEALRVLGTWQERIPASDLGLAVALAGNPAQGVAILTDVVRGGENTPKARQNLAYAYALGGQWAEARIIAMQDVPGDQLDARLTQWARMASPSESRTRVAALLGTPRGVTDPGQPAMLALGGRTDTPRYAKADPVPTSVAPVRATAPAPSAVRDANGELPALAKAEPMPAGPVVPVPAVQRDVPAAAEQLAAVEAPQAKALHPAFAEVDEAALEAGRAHVRFISRPIVQRIPEVRMSQAMLAQAEPVAVPERAASVRPAPARTAAMSAPAFASASPARLQNASLASAESTHLVQLGSFRTIEGAKRAWGIFVARDPKLKDHTMRITEAMVAGRRYYRVAAEGFDRGSASSMCSSVQNRGHGCFAYAETRPLPGALPNQSRGSGILRAR